MVLGYAEVFGRGIFIYLFIEIAGIERNSVSDHRYDRVHAS